MASVQLTTDQVIDMVRKLPPDGKREVLKALAADTLLGRDERRQIAEQQLRQLCLKRGLDWDAMNEAEREALADDLIHEDRACRK